MDLLLTMTAMYPKLPDDYSHVSQATEIMRVNDEISLDNANVPLLKDFLSTGLTNLRMHKDWGIVAKARRDKTAGRGRENVNT